MTVFQNYFDAMNYDIRVMVMRKYKPELEPVVVTLRTAAKMAQIRLDDLLEVMRAAQSFENDKVSIRFSPLDNGPEHMPKRT
jgi:hypothetical protein